MGKHMDRVMIGVVPTLLLVLLLKRPELFASVVVTGSTMYATGYAVRFITRRYDPFEPADWRA